MTLLNTTNAILTLFSAITLAPIAVFCLECLAAFLPKRPRPVHASPDADRLARPRTAVLIPAHNEERVLTQTLESLVDNSIGASGFRVVVVADNCEDQTADLAERFGAVVVRRFDPARRGKGFALQAGVDSLRNDPPEVVVVLDADCLAEPESIATLAETAHRTQRPVQAVNLTDRNPAEGSIQAVSLLGNIFCNRIRPLGLSRLGLPCRLTGTGMAFPWKLIADAKLAGGNLVEDMQLGIDLAMQGHFPVFCPDAKVTSAMPEADRAFVSQRTRWEQGHLRTAFVQIPRLAVAAFRQRSWRLLGVAIDLGVPPLSLLVALWLGGAILSGAAWLFGAAWHPFAALIGGGAALAAAIALGWATFCRRHVPLRSLAAVPIYMLRKMPIYARLLFGRQHTWVRTERPPAALETDSGKRDDLEASHEVHRPGRPHRQPHAASGRRTA